MGCAILIGHVACLKLWPMESLGMVCVTFPCTACQRGGLYSQHLCLPLFRECLEIPKELVSLLVLELESQDSILPTPCEIRGS